jgi:hypothetical protein
VAAKDPPDRAGRHAELGAEPVLAPAMLGAGVDHERLNLSSRPGRAVVRTRRPVDQAGFAFGIETSQPPVNALTRDPHRSGDVRHRPVLGTNPLHEQAPTMKRQTSVTVTHEDLRVVKTAISTAPEVFAYIKDPVTNVLAEYI